MTTMAGTQPTSEAPRPVGRPPRISRQMIAEAAHELGLEGLTLRAVADRLDVSIAALYHHVSGKEEFLRLAVSRGIDLLDEAVTEAEDLDAPAVQRLECVVRRSVEVLVDNLPYVTLLLRVRGNTATELWALDRRRELDARTAALTAKAVADGLDVVGPVPGDTVFVKLRAGQYDAVVAMYHDQGHIPVKLLGFNVDPATGRWEALSGVNITLGLPIVRTSPDHGTAFGIAGTDQAHPGAMIAAIALAGRAVLHRATSA